MKTLAVILSVLVIVAAAAASSLSLASFAQAQNKTISTTLTTTTTNGSIPTPVVNNNTIVNDTQLDDSNIPPITNITTVQ